MGAGSSAPGLVGEDGLTDGRPLTAVRPLPLLRAGPMDGPLADWPTDFTVGFSSGGRPGRMSMGADGSGFSTATTGGNGFWSPGMRTRMITTSAISTTTTAPPATNFSPGFRDM